MQKHIAVDEDGYFLLENDIRLNDNKLGYELLSHLRMDEHFALWSESQGANVLVDL